MIGWLLETCLAVTALMLLVLAVRRPVTLYLGAGCAYALWLLPLLRLVLPPLPEIFPSLSLPPVAAFIPAMDGVAASLPVNSGPGQWVPFMLALWAGGAVTFLLWHWLAYRDFLCALKAGARPGDPPDYGGIPTLASDAVDGPLALGVIERWIVLPAHFARRYNPAERRLAMEHELVHHRRGDIWWNLAGLILLALNWFNPVAWFAFHAFRSDQELACDAAVAKRASLDERHDYARALVKSASRPGLIAACPLNRAGQLKRRLRLMRSHRVSAARTAGGSAAFATLLVAGLAFSASGSPIVPERQVASAIPFPIPAANPSPRIAALPAATKPRLPATRSMRAAPPAPPAAAPTPPAAGQEEMHLAGLAREAGRFERFAALPLPPLAEAPREIHLAQMQLAVAPKIKVRHDRTRAERVVTFHVDGDERALRVAASPQPEQLARAHAAVARAMAEARDEEARERLGEVRDALERELDRIGMNSSLN